jgi:hypothetical protein
MKKKAVEYEIAENDCWICTSHKSGPRKYPHFYRNGKYRDIGRWLYEQHNGLIPKGLVIRHKCDNPKCINPAHLEIGTQHENVKDMVNRGRSSIGIKHGRHKLTDIQVLEILKLRASGEKIINLAKKFHVSNGTISLIANKKTWRNIKEVINDYNDI